jgi:hypothetical protein
MTRTLKTILGLGCLSAIAVGASLWDAGTGKLQASSHREAPLISNDPLADNTDLYVFRSPYDTNKVTIIANYIPVELPQGGPNYYSIGENIRYEIHVENNGQAGDDVTYRFTFSKVNEDSTTFFNIRLGKQNLKTTYKCEKSVNGGNFFTIIASGTVPPPNIGPRSISGAAGLGAANYGSLMGSAIANAAGPSFEKIFCGQIEDPFFADIGSIFDLGGIKMGGARDGLGNKNVHSIVIQVPIASLQKDGLAVSSATNILDSRFVIGVWASASRPATRTLAAGSAPNESGAWIQVSRIGMPLTNEAIIPIGSKDRWNSRTPYNEIASNEDFFCNPELALYMDNSQFGGSVPGLSALRIQSSSLQQYDFRNGKAGLFGIKGTSAVTGTALDDAAFGNYLLRANKPRSVDILPIFHTGVPNLPPYQLATGKSGNPLAAGKPFINNFLPIFGDMLRLNMAVPVTPRDHPSFSPMGLVHAAVLGLTDPNYNGSSAIQFIPNMDGFPNGRRLEDDVTRIELQAVGGVVLAAIGLWYDDYTVGGANPVTPQLASVLGFGTGVNNNDMTFNPQYPYVAMPFEGYANHSGQ